MNWANYSYRILLTSSHLMWAKRTWSFCSHRPWAKQNANILFNSNRMPLANIRLRWFHWNFCWKDAIETTASACVPPENEKLFSHRFYLQSLPYKCDPKNMQKDIHYKRTSHHLSQVTAQHKQNTLAHTRLSCPFSIRLAFNVAPKKADKRAELNFLADSLINISVELVALWNEMRLRWFIFIFASAARTCSQNVDSTQSANIPKETAHFGEWGKKVFRLCVCALVCLATQSKEKSACSVDWMAWICGVPQTLLYIAVNLFIEMEECISAGERIKWRHTHTHT